MLAYHEVSTSQYLDHTERTRNVMFPSSKKKRLCGVNEPYWVDRGILVSVDFTDKPNDREDKLSPMISLDKSEGAVMMVSEEITVDADGDSGPVIGMVWGC